MRFEIASVDSIIIYFGDKISQEISKDVRGAFFALKNEEGVKDIIPSYTSLFITYDVLKFDYEDIVNKIKSKLENKNFQKTDDNSRLVEIPVFYDKSVGLDLERISNEKNLSIDKVINIHSQKEYFVYTIGFAPGFAYMGEVDKKIATPRLANPRVKIPKGSVALADIQTAIYPKESPGGWNIIGRTPIEMFSVEYDGFSYLKVGDRVKFKPVSKEEFLSLGGEI